MSDPITWYALGRDVSDTETILEAVDAKILTHNLDPSAHGQENESLYEHRAAELLDHLSYSIYNLKMNPAARIYKAIVGTGLEADFTTLQAAIDWAHLYNGGTVFIKAGTYTLSADITLYSDIELLGEDDDTTIIDCNNTAYHIKAIGTSGTRKKNIRLRHVQVKNFLDGGIYKGAVEFEYVDDSIIEDCYALNNYDVVNDAGAGVNLKNCRRVYVKENRFVSNGYPVYLESCTYCQINNNYAEDNQTGGIYIYLGNHNQVNDNTGYNNGLAIATIYNSNSNSVCRNLIAGQTGEAVYINGSDYNIVHGNRIDGSAAVGNGIRLVGSDRNSIVGNIIDTFDSDGIEINSDSDYNVINGNIVTGCTTGIGILNANCNTNIVTSNHLLGNSTAFTDSGTGTISANNAI